MISKLHKCLGCGHEWTGKSGESCPACGNDYVQWINYDQWRKASK